MAQEQHRLAGGASGELNLQVVTVLFLRIKCDLAADPFKFMRDDLAKQIDIRLAVAGRLDPNQALERFQHLRLVLLAELQKRQDALHLRCTGGVSLSHVRWQ